MDKSNIREWAQFVAELPEEQRDGVLWCLTAYYPLFVMTRESLSVGDTLTITR
jgi:hypothetical protein